MNNILIIVYLSYCLYLSSYLNNFMNNTNDTRKFKILSYIFVAIAAVVLSGSLNYFKLAITVLITIWGITMINKEEQREIIKYKTEYEKFAFKYLLDMGFMLLIMSPIIYFNLSSSLDSTSVIYIFGSFLWIFGFVIKLISYSQKDSEEEFTSSGLYKIIRQPYYLGEIILWIGLFLMTITNLLSLLFIVSPITIIYLTYFEYDIPYIEKKLKDNSDYLEYKKVTPLFIPRLKK